MKDIKVGQDVYVVTRVTDPINARVQDVTGERLILSLYATFRDPMGQLAGQDVAVQFVGRRGVCNVPGKAQRSKQAATIMEFVATGKPQVMQRRDFVRVQAIVRVTYVPPAGDGQQAETTTVDVSAGGFLLAHPGVLEPGDEAWFTLHIGDPVGPLTVGGRAVRMAPTGALGVEITDIGDYDREALVHWVFARERLARQVMRGG